MATQCQKHLAMNFQGPSLSPQIDVYIQFLNRPYNKFYTSRKGPATTCPIVLNTSGLWELLYTGSIWPFLKKNDNNNNNKINTTNEQVFDPVPNICKCHPLCRGYQYNLCLDWRHHRNPLINWLVRLLLTQASMAWVLV